MSVLEVNNLVVTGDLHCGCKMGLCPPGKQRLEGGGSYTAGRTQRDVWRMWTHFWDEYVPKATHGEPYAIVFNGDTIEGEHHKSTTPITGNKTDQARIAKIVLRPVIERSECIGVYFIRGSKAHDDEAGQAIETLAEELGAIPDEDGFFSRWELRKRVGRGLVQIMHTIGTTSSSQHETSALNAEIARVWTECARWGIAPPMLLARAHRHRSCEVRLPAQEVPISRKVRKKLHIQAIYAGCFVTAGWQGKTPYTYKTASGRTAIPQFGGSVVRQGDEELHTRHCVWPLDPPREE